MRRKFTLPVMVAATSVAVVLAAGAGGAAQASPTISYTWASPTAVAAPVGNVLEAQNVGTSNTQQQQFSPVVASDFGASGGSQIMSLPTGTYNWTFDFKFITAPSTFFGFMRASSTGNSLFNNIPITGVATNQWYQASTTVTVTGGPWTGDTEIGDVQYGSTPAVTNEVLFDNLSFTDSSNASVYEANPINFESDTVGQAPPSSQITNPNFSTLQVIAVPEPATLGLVGVGALGLLLVGKRRRLA